MRQYKFLVDMTADFMLAEIQAEIKMHISELLYNMLLGAAKSPKSTTINHNHCNIHNH